jgi:beta-lactamase regulating signal transducer with metallopeptidase domain
VHVLANWLLQGSALAAVTTILLRLVPRISATARYRVWWLAMFTVLALPILNWLPPHLIAAPMMTSTATPAASYEVEMPALPWWPIAIAFSAYALWTSWSLVCLGRALLYLRSAKRRCRDLPLGRQNRLPRWRALRDRGRRARLVVSDDVRTASVLGLTSPAIAVAPTLLGVLDDDELDCILVHEWAHVQRRDDFARLLQVLLRATTGLHPAIWWIDRQLHIDRETACDDWTVNLTGSAKRYAACLTKLAAHNLTLREAVLLPAVLSPGDLTRRVTQLLDRRRSTSTKQRVTFTALSLSVLIALAMFVAGIQLVRPRAVDAGIASAPIAVSSVPQSLMTLAPPRAQTPAPPDRPTLPRRQRSDQETATERIRPAVASDNGTPSATPSSEVQPPDRTAVSSTSETPGASPSTMTEPIGEEQPTPVAPAATGQGSSTPWGAAADAGVSIGKGSRQAGVATAGFFSRLGKSIARRF